jgi:phosphatidylglycerol---prolipoprotein diacylglyceryl transferase
MPWGITFTNPQAAIGATDPALLGVKVEPTELFEFAYNIVILAVLWFLRKRIRAEGMLFWVFTGLYGIFRFLVEFLRVRPVVAEAFGIGLGGSQLFSLLLVLISAGVIVHAYTGKRNVVGEQLQA